LCLFSLHLSIFLSQFYLFVHLPLCSYFSVYLPSFYFISFYLIPFHKFLISISTTRPWQVSPMAGQKKFLASKHL
jgi:hypothetical protein